MVSKARLDLPEPDRPVMTTSWSRGISRSTFLRLCSRAPRTTILSWDTALKCSGAPAPKLLRAAYVRGRTRPAGAGFGLPGQAAAHRRDRGVHRAGRPGGALRPRPPHGPERGHVRPGRA